MTTELADAILKWTGEITDAVMGSNPDRKEILDKAYANLYDAIQNEPMTPLKP